MDHVSLELIGALFITTNTRTKKAKDKAEPRDRETQVFGDIFSGLDPAVPVASYTSVLLLLSYTTFCWASVTCNQEGSDCGTQILTSQISNFFGTQ